MARLDKQFESAKTDWETPTDLFDKLNDEFKFDLDVAASRENTKCLKFISKDQDALSVDWTGVCWCNPPYGRELQKWAKKAAGETWRGVTTVMLIPARTNTRWWHDVVIPFSEVRFIKGRPKFGNAPEGLPWPLAILVFRGKPSL